MFGKVVLLFVLFNALITAYSYKPKNLDESFTEWKKKKEKQRKKYGRRD